MRSLIEYRKVLDCRNAVAKLAASGPLICPKASQTAANRESTASGAPKDIPTINRRGALLGSPNQPRTRWQPRLETEI